MAAGCSACGTSAIVTHILTPLQTVLFLFCFCNELFFVALYLNALIHTPIFASGALWGVTWPQVLCAINFPLCFGKQIISIVQFWKASKIVSTRERERASRRVCSARVRCMLCAAIAQR